MGRFLDREKLFAFALRELLYAEDMLAPSFGYRPKLALDPELEPARVELVRDRFRVLWEARVAGRAERRSGREADASAPRRFRRAFAPLGDEATFELYALARTGALATFDELVEHAAFGATVA